MYFSRISKILIIFVVVVTLAVAAIVTDVLTSHFVSLKRGQFSKGLDFKAKNLRFEIFILFRA